VYIEGAFVGRPKEALISKSAVLELALRIIDTEGLDALSVRRIGEELGVHSASLYHHFENKHEIVVSAAELALARTPMRLAGPSTERWQEVLLVGAQQLRDFLLAHPSLAPVIIQRRSEGMGNRFLENGTKHLLSAGVRFEIVAPLYEAMERFVIGTVMRQIAESSAHKPRILKSQFPLLAEAASRQSLKSDDLFEVSILGIINAIEQYSPKARSRVTQPTPIGKKRPRSVRLKSAI
jgi:TetR/AcrR family transcriptional regulator, tetracycline repressor protein